MKGLFEGRRGIELFLQPQDLETEIIGPNTITAAEPHEVTFCKYDDTKGIELIRASQSKLIIVPSSIDRFLLPEGRSYIIADNPRLEFVRLVSTYFAPTVNLNTMNEEEIEELKQKNNLTIGRNVVIERNVEIGMNVIIHHNVVIKSGTRIGNNVVIDSGAVIGHDGFGYEKIDGKPVKFPHLGGVIIEDNVEIGANVCIDRGALPGSPTLIRSGAKIDNLVHIAHNVEVGSNSYVIALAMVAGSVKLGDNTWIAPSSAILQGLKIGENATVGMGAVVFKNIPANATCVGNPARVMPQKQ